MFSTIVTPSLEWITNNPYDFVAAIAVVIVALAIADLITFFREKSDHRDYKAAMFSLGILGTFIGIVAGLHDFGINIDESSATIGITDSNEIDTAKMREDINDLLKGLWIAFMTSVVGISCSVIVSILQRLFDPVRSDKFISEIRQIKEVIINQGIALRQEVKEEIDELRTALTSSQREIVAILEKSLKQFTEEALQNMLSSLQQIIEDFNAHLTSQFGEIFKQLSEACLKLVEWQEQHQKDLELSRQSLNEAKITILSCRDVLDSVTSNHKETLAVQENLKAVIEENRLQLESLSSNLGSFTELNANAKKTLDGFSQSLIDISTTHKQFVTTMHETSNAVIDKINGITDTMRSSGEAAQQSLDKQIGVFDDLHRKLLAASERHDHFFSDFYESVDTVLEEIEIMTSSISENGAKLQDKLTHQLEEFDQLQQDFANMTRKDAKYFTQLHDMMQSALRHIEGTTKELQKSGEHTRETIEKQVSELEKLQHAMTSMFSEEYFKGIKDLMNHVSESISNMASDLTHSGQKSQVLLNSQLQQIEGMHNEMSETFNNMQAVFTRITNELANNYQKYKTAYIEAMESSGENDKETKDANTKKGTDKSDNQKEETETSDKLDEGRK